MVMAAKDKYKNNLEFEVKLIGEIKKRPNLYKLTNDRKRIKKCSRLTAWKEIEVLLGQPADVCKRKWNNLKNTFKKQHSKNAEKCEDTAWIHYENMKSFLGTESLASENNTENQEEKFQISNNQSENEIVNIYTKIGEVLISNSQDLKFICWQCSESHNNIEHFIGHVKLRHIDSDKTMRKLFAQPIVRCSNDIKNVQPDQIDAESESQENQKDDIKLNITVKDENTGNLVAMPLKSTIAELQPNEKGKRGRRKFEEISDNSLESKQQNSQSKRGIFSCNDCHKIFEYKSQLISHKRLHTDDRPYKCEVCEQAFRHHRNLKDHFTVCHTEERPFTCKHDGCNKKFKTIRIRKLHEILHTNDLLFQCQDCGKCFPQNSYLITHRNTWHVDKKNRRHKCQHCDKTYYSKQSLKFHTYTHTGEKPYGCPICPTRFTKPWSVKEHMKIHCGERNYVCKVCGAAFNQIAGLIKHKKRHEKIVD